MIRTPFKGGQYLKQHVPHFQENSRNTDTSEKILGSLGNSTVGNKAQTGCVRASQD
jgi:hypothetical protein